MKSSFASLPEELKLEIVYHLSAVDILRISRVCKLFHRFIQSNQALLYHVELEIAGLRDGTLQSFSEGAEKLSGFIERRKRAKNETKTADNLLSAPPSRSLLFRDASVRTQVVGNVLVRITLYLVSTYRSNDFYFTNLTTFETWCWSAPVPHEYKRLRICPKMNLFVGVRIAQVEHSIGPLYLDIIDLKTGSDHPHAIASTLVLTESAGKKVQPSPFIRIMKDLLFVWWMHSTLKGNFRRTTILNWKTGRILKDDERTETGCPRPLSQDFVIRQKNLDSYNTSIEVQYRSIPSEGHCDYPVVARFLLPRLSHLRYRPREFLNPCARLHLTEPDANLEGSTGQKKTLMPSREAQLVFLTFGGDRRYYTLVTPMTTFTNYEDFLSDQTNSPLIVPWVEWGPANCRLLSGDCGNELIHGFRFMLLNGRGGVKEILDFNQLDIARDRGKTSGVTKGLRIDYCPLFEDRVETWLPYRTVLKGSDQTPSHLTWILREEIHSLSTGTDKDVLQCFKYDEVLDL